MADDKTDETADEAPTEPTAAAEPPDTEGASGDPDTASRSGLGRGVTVPMWALGLVALLVLGLIGFGIGRWTAPDDSDEVSGVFQGQVGDNGGDPQLEPGSPDSSTDANRVILGVQAADSTDPESAELVEVLAIGPAGKARLEESDVVTAIDGDDITSAAALAEAVEGSESGDEVTITYERDGETDEVDVTLQSVSEITPPGQGGGSESNSDAA
ncbi:MAG: PDZ domain-containing protein [Acidimicrobiia bacterium]